MWVTSKFHPCRGNKIVHTKLFTNSFSLTKKMKFDSFWFSGGSSSLIPLIGGWDVSFHRLKNVCRSIFSTKCFIFFVGVTHFCFLSKSPALILLLEDYLSSLYSFSRLDIHSGSQETQIKNLSESRIYLTIEAHTKFFFSTFMIKS